MKYVFFTLFILVAAQGFSQTTTAKQQSVQPKTAQQPETTVRPARTQQTTTQSVTAQPGTTQSAPAGQSNVKAPTDQPKSTLSGRKRIERKAALPAEKQMATPATRKENP